MGTTIFKDLVVRGESNVCIWKSLTLTSGNYSKYYNSTTQTLTLPAGVDTVIFNTGNTINLKYVIPTGTYENYSRLKIFVGDISGSKLVVNYPSKTELTGTVEDNRIYMITYHYNRGSASVSYGVREDFRILRKNNKWFCSHSYLSTL